MQKYTIYISEPSAIDASFVKVTLGDMQNEIILGDPSLRQGNPAICDTIIIRSETHINSSVRERMPQLKNIVRVGTGLDNVDLDFCQEAGIAVYNAAGANAAAVAEYVITMSLVALRKLRLMDSHDIQSWNRFKFVGQSLSEQTIGIIGFGNVGRLAYRNFRGLGCKRFVIHDTFVKSMPEDVRPGTLEEVLQESSIICLLLPLLPNTRHCINADTIQLIRPGAILINVARGGLVDEEVIARKTKAGILTYIADVVEGEPHVNPALLHDPNIILTPHIASLTESADRAMVTESITHMLAGEHATVTGMATDPSLAIAS